MPPRTTPSAPAAATPPQLAGHVAAIVRGPHPCPWCEGATWTDPPVPWTAQRDFLSPCEWCSRPIVVRVDRARASRRHVPVDLASAHAPQDPVARLLEQPGPIGFLRRLVIAAIGPLAVATAFLAIGGPVALVLVAVLASIVPAARSGPALGALVAARLGTLAGAVRPARGTAPVTVARGRWDQWLREQRQRQRERSQQPEAVLEELRSLLGEREWRRVRLLAERGGVPAEHLDDLLRFRRSWCDTHVA